MTRDDIIRMAREAGFNHEGFDWREIVFPIVERFAAIIAAAEREQCAKVADQIEREIFDAIGDPRIREFKSNIGAAIRARGQQ